MAISFEYELGQGQSDQNAATLVFWTYATTPVPGETMTEEVQPQEVPPQGVLSNDRQARITNVPRNLKPYFLGFLMKGERWNDTQGGEDLQPRQMAFIREQIEAGRYVVAGPVLDGGDTVGFAIIAAASLEDAQAIGNQDPAVQSRRLTMVVRSAYLPSLDSVKVEYSKPNNPD